MREQKLQTGEFIAIMLIHWPKCYERQCIRELSASESAAFRACVENQEWVAQTTGLAVRRPAGRIAARGFLQTPAQLSTPLPLFRSAGRRPGRASRPFHPFFTQALQAA